jgi:dolichyl-phosphate beta-glucosyltransferase
MQLSDRGKVPYIVPYMHNEGWIFDVEMLMLAEFAGIQNPSSCSQVM